MSLILDALRKSEQQRRLGEPPTLGSESAWAARRWHAAPSRGLRAPWIVGALALAAAAAGIAWWLWPVVAPALERASAMPTATTLSSDPAASTPATTDAEASPGAASMPSPGLTPKPPPETAAGTDALPSIRTEPPPGEDAAAATVPLDAPPNVQPLATAPPQPMIDPEAQGEWATIQPMREPARVVPGQQPATTVASPAAADDVPLVYTLPLATRQALPRLRLTMHVWNEDPARRFVILGDARTAEGEAAGDSLTVVEIRRDGVVLDFRGTRFLLPRGGY